MKKQLLKLILILVLIQLIFISCTIPTDFEVESKKEGKFKVVNSWGTSRYKDNPNRFFYITYDFLKNLGQKGMYAITLEAESDYEPQAVAVFKMKHPSRSDCSYKIIKGDVSNPEQVKVLPISEGAYFPNSLYYLFMRNKISSGIDMAFPEGFIVVDITELLPLNNQSITLEITDRNPSYQTGEIERFWIETYERQYDLKRRDNLTIYKCDNLPVKTENDGSIYITIPNLTIEKKNDYSIYSKSEEPLLKRTKDATKLPLWWDNSESIHFPPIGTQATKGSCTAWSLVYYVAGFNEARKHGWDLSNTDIESVDKSKILSPDFAYLLTMDYDFKKQEAKGSSQLMVCKLLTEIGCCTWDKMPYDYRAVTPWPSTDAWRDAALHRQKDNYVTLIITPTTDEDIELIKSLLFEGYLVSITLNGDDVFEKLTEDYLLPQETSNVINYEFNHQVTIVGYADDISR